MAGAPLMVPVSVNNSGVDAGEAALSVFVLAFGAVADDLTRYGFGDAVSDSGRLRLTRYRTPEGEARESWECLADDVRPGGDVSSTGARLQ